MNPEQLKSQVEKLLTAAPEEQNKLVNEITLEFSQGLSYAADKSQYLKNAVNDLNEVLKEILPAIIHQ